MVANKEIQADMTRDKEAMNNHENESHFDLLLANISASFINLPADRIDGEIENAQRLLCEYLNVDLCAVWQVLTQDQSLINLTHLYKHQEGLSRPEKIEARMIIATFRMTIPPKKCTEALKILRLEYELCRDNPGCHSCQIYGDLEDKKAHMIEELWWTEEELDTHLRSDEFRNLLLVMEMADKKPEIRFDTVSRSAGIEMFEKARGLVV